MSKTRSGKVYQAMTTATPADMTELVKMLLQDRQRRDEEIARRETALAEERAVRDAEARRREEAWLEERAKREEEHELRVTQLHEQLKHMQVWMEKAQTREDERLIRADRRDQLTLTKFSEKDDVEAYLTMFERIMEASGVEKERCI